MTTSLRFSLATLGLCGLVFLSGCAMETTAVNTPASAAKVSGVAMGAHQPIVGATITLYDAGKTGYGSAPTVLGTGMTDANGAFSITHNANTCADPDQLYIISSGGNPGAGSNTAGVLVAAMGLCSTINSGTNVYMNEATTIAAAYALAPFALADGDSINIGSSSTNTAGLQHAFTTANNLVSYSTGQVQSTTQAGNGVVPTGLINTLSNSLAACVNTNGGGGPAACSTVEVAPPVAAPNVTCATTSCIPDNTWQVALQWAMYPGNNVTAVLNNSNTFTNFYTPTVGATPTDLSVAITYTAGFKTNGLTPANSPLDIKADSQGNLWVVGMSGAQIVELGPDGSIESNPAGGDSPTANTVTSANGGGDALFSVAIDTNDNPWSIDPGNQSATPTPIGGNLWEYSPGASTTTQVALPSSTLGVGNVAFPPYGEAIGIDATNDIWYGSSATGAANGFNEYLSTSGTFQLFVPSTLDSYPNPNNGFNYLTVDASTSAGLGTVWAGFTGASAAAYFTLPYITQPAYVVTANAISTNGSAIDGADNLWLVGSGTTTDNTGSLYMTASSSTSAPTQIAPPGLTTGGTLGLTQPLSIAIDGIGRLFIGVGGSTLAGNTQNGGIAEYDPTTPTWLMTHAGANYVPYQPVDTTGTGVLAQGGPANITIDSAGAIWTINAGAGGSYPVVQILGAAAPATASLAKGVYGICTGTACATKDGRP